VLLLNTIIMARRAPVSFLCGFQVVAGIAIVYAGIKYDQHSPPLPGSFTINHLQTGLNVGVVSSYMVALLVFAVKAVDKHNADSAWCHVLVTMPMCFSIMALAFLRCLKTFRCPPFLKTRDLEKREQALIMVSYNNTVKKWNAKTGHEVKALDGAHQFHRRHGLRPQGLGTLHGFQRQHGEEVECEDGLRGEDAGGAHQVHNMHGLRPR